MPANLNRRSFAVTAAPGAAGNFSVGAAVTSMLSLDATHDGQTIPTVLALDGTAWEVRINCVYTHGTLTLTRGTLQSSSTGSAITLSASAVVTVTMSATVQDSPARVDLPNQTASVALTAASTVDVTGVECLAITQTTASITLTLPSPTIATAHKTLTVENVGSVAVTIAGADSFALNSGESRGWRWNGTNWRLASANLTTAQVTSVQALAAGTGSALKSIKNFAPKNYPLTRKAMGTQAASGTSFPVLCIGDSTTQGYDGTLAGCVARSWVRRLADALTAKGIKAGWQNFLGDHRSDSQTSTIQAVDTRVTAVPSGWSLASGSGIIPGPGGQYWINGSNINPITFTPTVNTDTCEWLYYNVSGYDNLLIKSGVAGVLTPTTGGTVTMGALNLIKKATATYTLGANVWTIQKQNANSTTAIIAGCSAYNSTLPEISLWNLGCGGQTTSYFNGTTQFWDTLSAMTATGTGFAAPLAIITLGINDWNVGTTQASMTTSLTAIVTALQAAGTEVLLVVPVPSVIAIASLTAQAAIQSAIVSVALAKDCAYIDLTERWISGAIAQPRGYYGDAQLHPSAFGYVDVCNAIAEFFWGL